MSRTSLADRLSLMAITDPAAPAGPIAAALAALAGGATAIQIRSKESSARDLLDLARALREPTRAAGALLLVNDRLDVALAAGADGVHLGDDDLPVRIARTVVPRSFVIGRSVDTPDEAATADEEGADYVGLGPIHPTATKLDTGPVVGESGIARVRATTRLPIIAIGGINAVNAAAAVLAGADGVAVIGAVMSAPDPESAASALVAEVRRAKARRRARSGRP